MSRNWRRVRREQQDIAIMRARAPSASPKRIFGGATSAAGAARRGRPNLLVRGRSATSFPAMASYGRLDAPSPGQRRDQLRKPCRRQIPGHSCEGDRLQPRTKPGPPKRRHDAEQLSVSCSPTDAKRNGSYSRPMGGANAACVMSSANSRLTPKPNSAGEAALAAGHGLEVLGSREFDGQTLETTQTPTMTGPPIAEQSTRVVWMAQPPNCP